MELPVTALSVASIGSGKRFSSSAASGFLPGRMSRRARFTPAAWSGWLFGAALACSSSLALGQPGAPPPAEPAAVAPAPEAVEPPPEVAEAPGTTKAPAEEPASPPEPDVEPEPDRFLSFDSRTLTGDWGGLRKDLVEDGVTFAFFVNQQFQSVAKGGLESSAKHSMSTDMFITLDLDKLGLMPNADVLGHFQSNCGAGINGLTGTLFEVNDDADGHLRYHVAQLWYRHHFLDRKLSLTLGFLDFQTIADRNAFSNSEDKQFWNQALDNNPLVPLNIGLGAAAIAKPTSWLNLILGVGDGQSVLYKPGFSTAFHDEALFRAYFETDFQFDVPSGHGPLPGNYRFGLMYWPGDFNQFARLGRDPESKNQQVVFYLSVDQLLYRERPGDDEGFGIFGRFGYRDPEINRIFQHWSAGMQYKGLIPERDDDVVGFAVAQQQPSHKAENRLNLDLEDETIYELYYAIQVAPWLVITPDVQYIDNPGANDDVGHTVVAGVRVRTSF